MFSSRLPRNLTTNALTEATAAHRAAGRPMLDLTLTNPTSCGIEYPADILAPLASGAARIYDPAPLGSFDARTAVAHDYARRGTPVAPERIVLTASTSDAYSVLFKLLCDPGDSVLVPVPSYPLFDLLSRMDAVVTVPYRLEYHGRWMVDRHSVESGWTKNTRAALVVSPNNPTGSVLSDEDLGYLQAQCASNDAALIIDEVFIDYLWDLRTHGPSDPVTLTFRLGGLSKSAGLPQVKLGWIAVDGPDSIVDKALARLELICDTYLSVSTPVQVAAADLIACGAAVRSQIKDRIGRNRAALAAAVRNHPGTQFLHADGGWSAVLRVPSRQPEEQLVLDLLERDEVLVHPGFFFDFPHEAFVVLSLLPAPAAFDEGVRRLLNRANG